MTPLRSKHKKKKKRDKVDADRGGIDDLVDAPEGADIEVKLK